MAVLLATLVWPVWRAAAAVATLPVDVVGGSWRWLTIGASGTAPEFQVDEGELFAPQTLTDSYDGFWLLAVDGNDYEPGNTGDVTTTAWGTVVSGAEMTLSGLTVTEQIAAFCFSPTLRVLVTLTNSTAEPIDVTVSPRGNFGSDESTTVEASSSGDTAFDTADRWLVTDGDSEDPVNTTVWFGPGSPAETSAAAGLSDDNIVADFEVSIPAGATRHLLFFSQLAASVSEATVGTADFDSGAALGAAGFLSGLTASELAATLNWNSLSASTPSIPCKGCGDLPNGTTALQVSFFQGGWLWDGFGFTGDEEGGPLSIEDAELASNGTDDAYDDFWILNLDGTDYEPAEDVDIFTGSGSFARLTASTVTISGLEVRQEFIACCDDPTLAVLITLHNPGGSEISVPLTVSGNVGSDSSTTVDATSSGDTVFDIADRWLVTDGDTDDPVNTFMFFGPGAPQSTPTAASVVDDDISVTFQATVAAGATQRYLFFSRLSETVAQATAGIAYLEGLAVGGSCGLTNGDLAGVANWQPQEAAENIPALDQVGLALLALALAAAGILVSRRA